MNPAPEFSQSNLSKIKPKLRTSGTISQPRRKAGSPLQSIGETVGTVGNLPTKNQYVQRLIEAYHKTSDVKLRRFIYEEVRKIQVQNGTWKGSLV